MLRNPKKLNDNQNQMKSKMSKTKYSTSFTVGALFYQESIKIAKRYVDLKEWNLVRNEVMETNLLQTRTQNTSKKLYFEICSRLKLLSKEELQILVNGSNQEQLCILWLAVCKRYKFIHDFAVEVVREKYLQMNFNLTREDYSIFFNTKEEWHEELESLTKSTKNKLRQILFKMLREADLITKENKIIPGVLTSHLIEVINKNSYPYLAIFPVSDSEVKEFATL